MATVTVPDQNRTLRDYKEIADYLSAIEIGYERWGTLHSVAPDTPAEQVLSAYAAEIDKIKLDGGYVTADVIDIDRNTPSLDGMLAKFNREHWHNEDEVRFTIHGRGLFHIRSRQGLVVAIEVEAGDLLRVPRGTWHWFNLCSDREIRVIRLFQDPAGWTPHYTESGVSDNYQPVCLGTSYFTVRQQM